MNDPILLNLTLLIIGIIGIWAPFRWKRSSKAQKALIILVVEWFITGYAEDILTYFHSHNLWLINLSTLIEFILIVIIFYYLKKEGWGRSLLIIIGACFAVFWLISKFTFEPLPGIGQYSGVVSRLLQILISVSALFDILKDSDIQLKNDLRIWVASGVLIYSTGSLILIILFLEILRISLELFKLLWHINFVLNIIAILLFARGLLCKTMQ